MEPGPPARSLLRQAEQRGFQLAVAGRGCALLCAAAFYLAALHHPANLAVPALLLALAAAGVVPLIFADRPRAQLGRYMLLAGDAAVVAAYLAFAPLSSGGDVPQNLVFLTSGVQYFYVVVALSALTLSPWLVLWTGACTLAGLAAVTIGIAADMGNLVSYGDMPAGPSREAYMAVVLNPDFLGVASRVNEAVKLALVTGIVALAVHRARQVVRRHAVAEAERGLIVGLFGRYLPAQVAETLVRSGSLAPQTAQASLVFADIAGFTALSEALPPADVIVLLNGFFEAVNRIVDDNGGVVVNYVGDAVIAAFNTPLTARDHAARAVATAAALLDLVAARDFAGHRLTLRIGVATGPVAAGTVGGNGRQTYTLYGDTVNLAQRLERLNKELGTACLVCHTTVLDLDDGAALVALGPVQVTGRRQPVEIHALVNAAGRHTRR